MERRWSVPIISALVALLAVVLVAPGLDPAEGAIPNKSGTYSACLTKSSGAVKVINYPKVKCAKGQRLIRWNAKGQPGAQGVQGVQGPQGPAGPADWNAIPNKPAGFADGVDDEGVTRVRVTQYDSGVVDVAAGAGLAGFFIPCPVGSVIVGGGYMTDLHVIQSRPDGPSDPGDPYGWEVTVERHPTNVKGFAMRATCLATSPPGALVAENIAGVSIAKLSPAQLDKVKRTLRPAKQAGRERR